MSSFVEIVAPRRFGTGFRWLLSSSWVSNLGDGIAIAAGPLLVASMTHDPILVASAALLQWLPPLVFGLLAGALAEPWGAPAAFSIGAALASVVLVLVAWRLRSVRMPSFHVAARVADEDGERRPGNAIRVA